MKFDRRRIGDDDGEVDGRHDKAFPLRHCDSARVTPPSTAGNTVR